MNLIPCSSYSWTVITMQDFDFYCSIDIASVLFAIDLIMSAIFLILILQVNIYKRKQETGNYKVYKKSSRIDVNRKINSLVEKRLTLNTG